MSAKKSTGGIVSIVGGSGFIGRHAVAALARRGWRIRVICRRPDLAGFLQPLGDAGQIAFVQANIRDRASLAAAIEGSRAVLNLCGILNERGKQTFEAVHVRGAEALARAAADTGAEKFVHVSAIGADAGSPARYGRSKAEGERRVRAAFPGAVILRPSAVVGPEDRFLNLLAEMARFSLALPLIGGGRTRFQPVWVGDVAAAIARVLETDEAEGRTYELGGPEVWTFRELTEFVLSVTRRKRLLIPVPFALARVMAWPMQFVPGAPLTPGQVDMLKKDNLVSPRAVEEGRTLQGLGITPDGIEAVAPDYLTRYSPAGQFAIVHDALAAIARRA